MNISAHYHVLQAPPQLAMMQLYPGQVDLPYFNEYYTFFLNVSMPYISVYDINNSCNLFFNIIKVQFMIRSILVHQPPKDPDLVIMRYFFLF